MWRYRIHRRDEERGKNWVYKHDVMWCCTKRCECKHNVQSNCLRGQWSDTLPPYSYRDKEDLRGEERGFPLSQLLSSWLRRKRNLSEPKGREPIRHMILTWQNVRLLRVNLPYDVVKWSIMVVKTVSRDDFIYFFSSFLLFIIDRFSIYNTPSWEGWEVKEWESPFRVVFFDVVLWVLSSVSPREKKVYKNKKGANGRLYDYTIRQNNNTINKN